MSAANDLLARFTAFRVDGVAERLPAPGPHPLLWRPGRALRMIEGADLHQQRNALPPTRGAFVAVSAMVTIGPDPAPVLLPLLSGRMASATGSASPLCAS